MSFGRYEVEKSRSTLFCVSSLSHMLMKALVVYVGIFVRWLCVLLDRKDRRFCRWVLARDFKAPPLF